LFAFVIFIIADDFYLNYYRFVNLEQKRYEIDFTKFTFKILGEQLNFGLNFDP